MVSPKDDREFWLGYVRAGLLVTLGALLACVPYIAFAGRDPRLWFLVAGVALLAAVVRAVPWERVIARGFLMPALYAWSAATLLALYTAALIDGGRGSPLRWIAVAALIFGSLAYAPRAVAVLTGLMIVMDGAVSFMAGEPVDAVLYMRLSSLALIGWMCAASARNHMEVAAKLRRTAARLEALALVDGLTGCFNHRAFQEELHRQVAAHRRRGEPLALLILDLDHFKRINDTRGHPAGDAVLVATATILRDQLRPDDVAARIGGEEFAVLLPRTSADTAVEIAERCRTAIGVHEGSDHVTVSVGVAALPDVATSPDELCDAADRALYRAKRAGRDTVMVTRPHDHRSRRVDGIIGRLDALLDGDALLAGFQPLVELATGRVVGWEALTRVAGSNMSALEWLELAEQEGRRAAMEVAMWDRALDAWHAAAPPPERLLALNVSPDVLVDGLPWTLRDRLPPRTVLELSEHAPVRSYAQLNAALDDWRAAHVAVAVDDVGAGHASLRHVLELRPDVLKLDRFLIHDVAHHAPKRALVHGLVTFCAEHGGRLVAEGVEDAATTRVLTDLGVDLAQGWYFGRPGPLPDPATWPDAQSRNTAAWTPGAGRTMPARDQAPNTSSSSAGGTTSSWS